MIAHEVRIAQVIDKKVLLDMSKAWSQTNSPPPTMDIGFATTNVAGFAAIAEGQQRGRQQTIGERCESARGACITHNLRRLEAIARTSRKVCRSYSADANIPAPFPEEPRQQSPLTASAIWPFRTADPQTPGVLPVP